MKDCNDLMKEYPTLFPTGETNMPIQYGLEVGPGWYKILKELLNELKFLQDNISKDITIVQVKEKFGTLTVYINSDHSSMLNTICFKLANVAEKNSAYICEDCGNSGKIRNTSPDGSYKWVKTLCDQCAADKGYAV